MWPAMKLLKIERSPVVFEHCCPVFIDIEVVRRRENSYDAVVAVTLAVRVIPIHNSNQQELQVIRRIRRTQPSAPHVRG